MDGNGDRVVRTLSAAYFSTACFSEFTLLGIALHNFCVTPDYIAALKTGMRVLTAISDRVNPAPADLEELLRFTPECSALPIDELACEVVQRAINGSVEFVEHVVRGTYFGAAAVARPIAQRA